jgi:hypothetical protein
MMYSGNILKMRTEYGNPVKYYLPVGENEVYISDLIGEKIKIAYTGRINCIKCGRETKKSFSQGYCYPCFISAPETEECVLHPEMCRAHEGIARDMEFAKEHCLISHIVYLAVSSAIKVGVTRETQVPARWIDQGASYTLKLARTPNRYIAGLIEVALKDIFADKTNWRNMLTNKILEKFDLIKEKNRAKDALPGKLKEYFIDDNDITRLDYPVLSYPLKVKSLILDKTPLYTGKLTGIKGQYLIFNDGDVLNIRKHGGYYVLIIKI